MEFGIKPPTGKHIRWSARAIFERGNRADPLSLMRIDIVWDRQQMEGGTEQEREAFNQWIQVKGLPLLRKLVKLDRLEPSENREISLELDGYRLVADPKRSHGYLYIGAWPIEDRTSALAPVYPPGWPKCPACEEPALDGHVTCGKIGCDEAGRRG